MLLNRKIPEAELLHSITAPSISAHSPSKILCFLHDNRINFSSAAEATAVPPPPAPFHLRRSKPYQCEEAAAAEAAPAQQKRAQSSRHLQKAILLPGAAPLPRRQAAARGESGNRHRCFVAGQFHARRCQFGVAVGRLGEFGDGAAVRGEGRAEEDKEARFGGG